MPSQELRPQDNHNTEGHQHQQWVQFAAPEECAGWSDEEWLAWWEDGLEYLSIPSPSQDAGIEREASQPLSPDVEIKREVSPSPIASIEVDLKQELSPSPSPPSSPPRVKCRRGTSTPTPSSTTTIPKDPDALSGQGDTCCCKASRSTINAAATGH